MTGISYIICAAGEGSRFQSVSSLPKPLLQLHGQSFLEWSLRSLSIKKQDTLIIVYQKSHRISEQLDSVLRDRFPFNSIIWHAVESLTRGQLDTAVQVSGYLNPDHPVVIYNADTYFQSDTLYSLFLDETVDGVVPCSNVEGTAWSFFQTEPSSMKVIQAAEKVKISEWGSVGFYYFRKARVFLKYANERLSHQIDASEYYVAPLYNDMIKAGYNIIVDPVAEFYPFGTPEQLTQFWDIPMQEFVSQNRTKVMVVDLDNTITLEESSVGYADKAPNEPLILKLQEFHQKGYKIIIHSARRMRTHHNDESAVVADIAEITIQWLKRHNVPFDGLKFGKPFAEGGFYIDDRAIRPSEFLAFTESEILKIVSQ